MFPRNQPTTTLPRSGSIVQPLRWECNTKPTQRASAKLRTSRRLPPCASRWERQERSRQTPDVTIFGGLPLARVDEGRSFFFRAVWRRCADGRVFLFRAFHRRPENPKEPDAGAHNDPAHAQQDEQGLELLLQGGPRPRSRNGEQRAVFKMPPVRPSPLSAGPVHFLPSLAEADMKARPRSSSEWRSASCPGRGGGTASPTLVGGVGLGGSLPAAWFALAVQLPDFRGVALPKGGILELVSQLRLQLAV